MDQKQLSTIRMLPVNKTVMFYTPIEGPENVLVRTGTLKDGSCAFHSVLHSYSKDYVRMDANDRTKFVKKLRSSMAKKIDKVKWESLGGGLISKIPFQENVNNILYNFYLCMKSDSSASSKNTKHVIDKLIGEDSTKLQYYRLLIELLPCDTVFEQNILPEAYEKTNKSTIQKCKQIVIEKTDNFYLNLDSVKTLDREKKEYIRHLLSKMMSEILDEAENSAFKLYVKGLKNVNEDVDSYTISLISDKFDRDIYFLDSTTRMPYNNASSSDNIKNRKSIIIMWIGGVHYEIVGRLMPDRVIQREFEVNDPLIVKLRTFLLHPEEISNTYPDLIPYIPKTHRKVNDVFFSDSDRSGSDKSESESESESESD
jgi:hypothetical protein